MSNIRAKTYGKRPFLIHFPGSVAFPIGAPGGRLSCVALVLLLLAGSPSQSVHGDDASDRALARRELLRAVAFYDEHVSVNGGYLWRYSADLKWREGEGKADADTAWVQPPGTPTVGEALLYAYQVTGEPRILAAAQRTGEALCAGQLVSGGWDYRIVSGEQRSQYMYRQSSKHGPKARNVTTLDDNTTQAALQFLMKLDRELHFKHQAIHAAAMYALDKLVAVQYPNGAWPQRFSEAPNPADFPPLPASYPQSWSREYPKLDYRSHYTFNDNSIADTIETMFMAHQIYRDQAAEQADQYRQAALRGGAFILAAQMPEPQPGWAQQYDREMHPAWARKFEPPAVTGGESQGVMRVLLELYDWSGEERFLKPIPSALAYFRRSLRPDGRLARFYELKTNRPLYFTKDYQLTYDDSDMPTHYGFIISSNLDAIERKYQSLLKSGPNRPTLAPRPERIERPSSRNIRMAAQLARELDQRGAWVTQGELRFDDRDASVPLIDSREFATRIRQISQGIGAASEK
ncbi:MAG: pectic acid lyase [Planctomycetales bacterium]|nr:pectic acid lyase [Planctomycetales bacterium]